MIQCFIKVAQRVPVVEKHGGNLCNLNSPQILPDRTGFELNSPR